MIVLHSHSWVWAVLPPGCRRVQVIGEPYLTAVLRASGFELVPANDPSGSPDAVLVTATSPEELRLAEQFLPGADLAAVTLQAQGLTFGGGSRVVRGIEELASLTGVRAVRNEAARVGGFLGRAGLQPEILPTSARGRPYAIGSGSRRKLRRLPVGAIVVGSRGARPPSTAEQAVTAASEATGHSLERVTTFVVESGKIIQELEDSSGRRFVQRVAGGPAASGITRSSEALRAIAGVGAPPAVLARLMLPVCEGDVGLARFTVEPKAPGGPPETMTEQLWQDCLEFLVSLHKLGHNGESFGGEAAWSSYQETLELLARHVGPERRPALTAIGTRLRSELGHVEVGWGHGDVWAQNLLALEGRISAVLDWDGACPHALPLLDLLDLMPAPGGRHSPGGHPGARMTDVLWPLLSTGDDPRLQSYCDALSIKRDRRHLQAFGVAYWLERMTRALQPFASRTAQPVWVRRNIDLPMTFLSAQGWA